MRYHIDTIPVWDALHSDTECPLCALEATSEASYVEFFLGGSVMEPAVRIKVNEKGFCRSHLDNLLAVQNRLGLTLMMHTHMQQLNAQRTPPQEKRKFLSRKAETPREAPQCALCDKLRESMDRYAYTLIHLFSTDTAFRDAFVASKGVCMPHYHALLAMATAQFSGSRADAFAKALHTLQQENMQRLEKELYWFTQKFDYRNDDKPWGNAKDSPERAIAKLRGRGVL